MRDQLVQGIAAGVFATVVMDMAFAAGKLAGFIRAPFPLPVGRWVVLIARGRAVHRTILEAPRQPAENPLTLVVHYLIGITLGVLFVGLAPETIAGARLFLAALVFGTCTSVLPWLIMFPAMGFGLFGRDGPPDAHMIRNSLYTHVAFGIGLGMWLGWVRPLF